MAGKCFTKKNIKAGAKAEMQLSYRAALLRLVLVLSLFGFSSPAWSATPAPSILPGFPMIAGDLIMVMWAPVPGAVKYKIYLNDAEAGESAVPPFQFAAPTKGGEYQVVVAGVDAGGAVGDKSKPGVFTITALEPPEGLTAMQMNPQEAVVSLRWNKTPGAAFYNIYRKGDADADYALLSSEQGLSYNDNTSEAEKTYLYKVASKSVTGKESAPTEPVSVSVAKAVVVKAEKKAVAKPWASVVTEMNFVDGEVRSMNEIKFKNGEIYILDATLKVMHVYDKELNWVKDIGTPGFMKGQFQAPLGFDFYGDKGFVVGDTSRKVIIVMDLDGNLINEFKVPKKSSFIPEDEINDTRAGSVAMDKKGEILAVDGANGRVVVFDDAGEFVTDFVKKYTGAPDQEAGFIQGISNVAVAPSGDIYVSDGTRGAVHIFDENFEPKHMIRYASGPGTFVNIGKMDFMVEKGVVLVPDPMLATVQAYSLENGDYVATLTSESGELVNNQLADWKIGSLRVLAVDETGTIWVTQATTMNMAKIVLK